jgi:simple sugar transport system permease protein
MDWGLISSGIRLATPLTLAAIGGLFSERSGIVNIALEGLMLAGAFAAATATFYSGNPWFGVLMAAVTGAVVAHIHGLVCVKFKGDHIVSGVAINILAMGAPPFIAGALFGTTGSTPDVAHSLGTWRIAGIGAVIGEYSPLVYLSWLAVPLAYVLVFRTRFGLRLRAAGENPWAAETAGVNVARVRYVAVLLSGVFAGLGGAFLSIGYGTSFVRNMSAGRGFLALAALIFGKWTPGGAFAACLLFGFFDALQIRLQGVGSIPPQFVQMIPYVVTMLVLVGAVGRARPPAALGKSYDREQSSAGV